MAIAMLMRTAMQYLTGNQLTENGHLADTENKFVKKFDDKGSNIEKDSLDVQGLIDQQKLKPYMKAGQSFKFDAWMSYLPPKEFYNMLSQNQLDQVGEPIWSSKEKNMTYEVADQNKQQVNLTFSIENTTDEGKYMELMHT